MNNEIPKMTGDLSDLATRLVDISTNGQSLPRTQVDIAMLHNTQVELNGLRQLEAVCAKMNCGQGAPFKKAEMEEINNILCELQATCPAPFRNF